MPRLPSKKSSVQQFVREHSWERIDRPAWESLRRQFAEISEATVQAALAEMAIVVDQPFAGVKTKTLEELEASLIAMTAAYPEARAECRTAVIAAKDRARFASLNQKAAPEKRTLKAEMVRWMLVWLADPAMFRAWVQLRKRAGLLQVE